jgi:transcriptional regulator with XRE-family HTH domain
MGRASRTTRHYPKRLGEKLLQIRSALELSQNAMLKRLGSPAGLLGTSISGYERGVREPPLLVLLAYARLAGIYVDSLIDDEADLPAKLSGRVRPRNTQRTAISGKKSSVKVVGEAIRKGTGSKKKS